MKIAVVGSRKLTSIDLSEHLLKEDVEEIVSGGAVGIDSCAAKYAEENGLKLTVFLPEYERYGRGAPIVRNKKIVDYADKILIFWNGTSKGTLSVINYARELGKDFKVVLCK